MGDQSRGKHEAQGLILEQCGEHPIGGLKAALSRDLPRITFRLLALPFPP